MADESEFDDFIVARSPALLRSAYLLVQDEGLRNGTTVNGICARRVRRWHDLLPKPPSQLSSPEGAD